MAFSPCRHPTFPISTTAKAADEEAHKPMAWPRLVSKVAHDRPDNNTELAAILQKSSERDTSGVKSAVRGVPRQAQALEP
jgi:hypothetical protein